MYIVNLDRDTCRYQNIPHSICNAPVSLLNYKGWARRFRMDFESRGKDII